jgi:photosystem II stability/assembly factor-like uncharacterized protein
MKKFIVIISLILCVSCQAVVPLQEETRAGTVVVETTLPSLSPTTLPASTPTRTLLPGPWQVVAEYNEHHSIMTAGFHDETFAITGGVVGRMNYSTDGGKTWPAGVNQSDCRYGMEIVSHSIAWTCGGMTHVRRSIDGGKTWQVVASFGGYNGTNPCHSMSFLDENIGWLATSTMFGATVDGGVSWSTPPLPDAATKIVTLDTYAPGQGYLLDQKGVLYFTEDDGFHWMKASQLELGGFAMPFSAYQQAAMRFSDAGHGTIVLSGKVGNTEEVLAFHTNDGGQSWVSEIVPVISGPVYLSRDSHLLTVITGPNILTLLRYDQKQ